MKNPSLIGFLSVIGFALVVYAYYLFFIKTENYILIDNPTENKIEVILGEKEYSIAPYLSAVAETEIGEQKMIYKIKDSTVLDTLVNISKKNTVINPTLANYYIMSQFYGIKKDKDSIFQNVKSIIESKIYIGEIEKKNLLSIDGFDYNLEDDFPEFLSDSELKSMKKIFREVEFKNYYTQNYE